MVRAGKKAKFSYSQDETDSEMEVVPDSEEEYEVPVKKKAAKATPKKSAPPSKRPSLAYKESESEVDFTDAGELDDGADSDFEEPKKTPKKKGTPAKRKSSAKKEKKTKKTPKKNAKKTSLGGRSSGRKKIKAKYVEEPEEEESEEEIEESESEEEVPIKKRKIAKQSKVIAKKSTPKKPEIPPVGEMVTTAISQLRDNPKKGSSLAAIKGVMAEEWGLNIPDYAGKIKKYLLRAVEGGEVVQTKGKGASGRFTLPGLKAKKRRKAKNNLTKKWDKEQEAEYIPKATARDEGREQTEVELEERRRAALEIAAKKELERANKPKVVREKKTEWEVSMIKGMKLIEDKTFYHVKWIGWPKLTWEPEENLGNCQDHIDNFLIEEKTRLREEETRRQREEEEGAYEVARILEVKFSKNKEKREFLIRWKGHGPDDDTWEPEENLNCPDMIQRFMDKVESIQNVSEKSLRAAPKKIERLNYASGRSRARTGRGQGFRTTYEGMDDDWVR